MATYVSTYEVDFSTIDYNWYVRFFTGDVFFDNQNKLLSDGVSYSDVYEVDANDGFDNLAALFGGVNFGFNAAGQIISGTVLGFEERDLVFGQYSVLSGISISAVAMWQAAQTLSTADDLALLAQALSGDDSFTLSSFDDNAFGYAGNDIMFGLNGRDTLDGGTGNDTLKGGADNDSLYGGDGRDRLEGGDGNDIIDASGGTALSQEFGDYIRPGLGSNTIIGHAALFATEGTDLSYSDLSGIGGLTLTIGANGTGTAVSGTAGKVNDTFTYIDYVEGSQDSDRLTGSNANHWEGWAGLGGADTINGGAGWDFLDYSYESQYGGPGLAIVANLFAGTVTDTFGNIDVISGIDEIKGTDTNDSITAAQVNSDVSFSGGLGNDTLTGGNGQDWIFGGDGNDALQGSAGNDNLDGGLGNDLLNGGAGNDTMVGGNGNDTYTVDNQSDVVSETTAAAGVGGTDTVNSLLAAYTLGLNVENGRIQAAGAANLTGNGLGNTLFAGAGNNILDGGLGTDTVSYSGASAGVSASLAIAGAQATGGSGSDSFVSIENLTGSNFNDVLTGNSAGNILIGGLGNDMLDGGLGSDTASYAGAASAVTVSLAVVGAQATGGAGSDTLINIENLTGSNLNDVLTGNAAGNILIGGLGNDMLDGGLGGDTASYAGGQAVTVSLALAGAQATGGAGTDTLVGIENLTGSNFNDMLTGDGAANVLLGGLGNDRLDGGLGGDTASYAGAAAVTVSLAIAGAQATGGAGTDTLISIENLTGSNFVDHLTGNGGGNRINGGLGSDILTGGLGADTFVFNTALGASNIDTITDFSVVNDTIWLDNAVMAAIGANGALAAGVFGANATGTASTAAMHLIYDTASGKLFYDADGNGAGAAQQIATLSTGLAMTGADFLVI